MRINAEKCTACGRCVPYCPVGAITLKNVSSINADICVECGTCFRADVCKTGAIEKVALSWPRYLRALFSDPLMVQPAADTAGRGTEMMKTNDVTHHYKRGQIGLGIELGRPGTGTSFAEVEKVTKRLAKLNMQFEPKNPVTGLIDLKTGNVNDPEIRNERMLSVTIEALAPQTILFDIVDALETVGNELETTMTVGLITTCNDSEIPILPLLQERGVQLRINGKVNLGLGLAWSYK